MNLKFHPSARPATSPAMIRFLFCLTLIVYFCKATALKSTSVDLDVKKMMEDIGRSVPDLCYTPSNLKYIFSRACEGVINDNITQCSFAWTAFMLAFGHKDPNTITFQDYDTYFDVLPIQSRPNSAVYWSGMVLESVVEEISKEDMISSSATHASSRIINIMFKDYNVTCWCGNKTAYLDTVNPCPITPAVALWQAYSNHVAESSIGVIYYIGDGSRAEGAYHNSSFFGTFEFPLLINARVDKLVAINIYDCNNEMVEKCGEGTLEVLENQAISKYGSTGYNCRAICGKASDKQQISLLANRTMQVIREEQGKGTYVAN